MNDEALVALSHHHPMEDVTTSELKATINIGAAECTMTMETDLAFKPRLDFLVPENVEEAIELVTPSAVDNDSIAASVDFVSLGIPHGACH